MKILCLILFVFGASCSQVHKKISNKRILFVVTSHDSLGKIDRKTGAYISEITHPYHVFKQAGFEIDFISPKGGNTPLDGMKKVDALTEKLLKDRVFMSHLQNTKTPSSINAKDYSAVYFAGGHGTMFDFPDNKLLQRLISSIYEDGGVVSGVCHGPASLVNVKLSNGAYLVEGKKVSAFTNEEEEAVKLTGEMPFLLESKLKSRGAIFEKNNKFQKKVVSDKKLVTGQNPASAEGVAKEVLSMLKSRSMY